MRADERRRRKTGHMLLAALLLSGLILMPTTACGRDTGAGEPYVEIRQEGLEITLEAPKGCTIYYTTDGSVPDHDSAVYAGPFTMERIGTLSRASDLIALDVYPVYDADLPIANVIRAFAVSEDGTESRVVTKTCFERNEGITVISVIMDYDDLLDYDTGIMVKGRMYDEWKETGEAEEIISKKEWYRFTGNYARKGKEWERPALIQIFDEGNEVTVNAGIRIKGNRSRMFSQRSLNVYLREKYGDATLDYDLFHYGAKRITSFSLRNGGNCSNSLKYKDTWLQDQLSGMDFSVQGGRPALVYINGEYWGIYTLHEKYDADFIYNHFGAEDIVLMERGELEEGEDETLYEDLLRFGDLDLTDPEVWERFKETVDVDSMADYFAAEIYIGNADWAPYSNYVLWRSVNRGEGDADGRWRFMLVDTDFSSATYDVEQTSYGYDSFSMALRRFPLFRAAMENEEFRAMYLESLREVKDRLSPSNASRTLAEYDELWRPYIEEYQERFGTTELYEYYYRTTRSFFEHRIDTVLS